jgi:hypothetical protein
VFAASFGGMPSVFISTLPDGHSLDFAVRAGQVVRGAHAAGSDITCVKFSLSAQTLLSRGDGKQPAQPPAAVSHCRKLCHSACTLCTAHGRCVHGMLQFATMQLKVQCGHFCSIFACLPALQMAH